MISEDLLSEIFVKLPVKSLLRCKSVSKTWLSVISNPNFIQFHIKRTPGVADQALIVYGRRQNSISLLNLDSCEIETPLGLPFSRGDTPFDPEFNVVGSSYNGVVCVMVSDFPRQPKHDIELGLYLGIFDKLKDPNIYLWNPATKRSKLIPKNIVSPKNYSLMVGFGFDPICNDFKVLRLLNSHDKPSFVEVYSANTNAWRIIEPNLTDYPKYLHFGVCVNGLLCCIGMKGMIAFDCNKEMFTCGVPLPVTYFGYCITDFNDSIAVIVAEENECNYRSNYKFKVWTLDDEACLRGGGVEASWTISLAVDVNNPYARVYGCLNSRDFLLLTEYNDWLLYNSDKKEARDVPVPHDIPPQLIKYNESLVLITGSKPVD